MNSNIKCVTICLKPEYLWLLRQQVDINSTHVDDYKNDCGIDKHTVRDFFRNYVAYSEKCAEEAYLWEEVCLGVQEEVRDGLLVGCMPIDIQRARIEFYNELMYTRFDNKETLQEFYKEFYFNDESVLSPE